MSLFKQSVLVAGARLVDKIFSFVIVLALSRHFGNEGLGQFNYFFSLVGLVLPLVDMGLGMTLLQRWNERGADARRLLATQLFLLKLACSTVALAVALGGDFINHFGSANPWAVCAAFVAVFFDELSEFFRRPAHASGVVWIEAAFPLLSRFAQLGLLLYFLKSMTNGFQALYIFAIANLLETIASIYGFKAAFPLTLRGSKQGDYLALLKNGLPFAVSGLFVMATLHFDSVLLVHYRGYGEAGLYTAATRIIMVLSVLNGGICHALFPKILKAKADGDAGHAGWLVNGTLRGFIILFGAMTLGGMATGPALMLALYGEKFSATGPIFQMLSPMILFGALYSLLGQVLELLGEQRKVMRIYAFSAMLNILGNILLIPRYGMYGSALATLLSSVFMGAILYFEIFKNEHVKLYVCGIGRAFIFLGLLAAAYYPLMGRNAYAAVPLGALIFALLLLPLRKYWLAGMGRVAK